MKFSVIVTIVVIFFSSFTECPGQHNCVQRRKRSAVAVAQSAFDIGSFIISTAFDIASRIEDNKQHEHEQMMSRLNEIDSKINDLVKQNRLTHSYLRSILYAVSKSPYQNAISNAEREINNCYDDFKTLARNPDSVQSLNNMKNCYSKISYVKEIGKIAGGQTIGMSQVNLFKLFIEQHGSCDGIQLVGLQTYLLKLLMKGCSVVTFAEQLQYGNTSSQYKDYCLESFNDIDNYRNSLFKSCAAEPCNTTLGHIAETLKSAKSASDAFNLLSNGFPWFYFMVIKTESCSTKCSGKDFNTFGNARFGLHTYVTLGKMFIVSYRDERYKPTGSGNPTGFDMPQSCKSDIQDNLGFNKSEVIGSAVTTMFMFEDYTVNSSTKICESRDFQCQTAPTGTASKPYLDACWFVVLASTLILKLLLYF